MAMFAAGLAQAGGSDYEEVRDLTLDASDLKTLSINAGAGSMDVTGVAGINAISVKATIVVPDEDEEKALKIIAKKMKLSLDRDGDEAKLVSSFDSGLMSFASNAYIVLDVSVPQGMSVNIHDGSGSIDVSTAAGDVSIVDGSGSIKVSDVENDLVIIDDGSGGLDYSNIRGSVDAET
jgi:hypothetical protein